MRSRILSSLVLALLGAGTANAQGPCPPCPCATGEMPRISNGFYAEAASVAYGIQGLGYEHVISGHASVLVEAQVLHAFKGMAGLDAYGASIRPHIYTRGSPSGFFISPFLCLVGMSASGGAMMQSGTFGYSLGAVAGWSWLREPMNLRLGIGLQYMQMGVEAGPGPGMPLWARVGFNGVLPSFEASFGFSF